MAIIDFDPKTVAELNAVRETMKTIEKLGATLKAAELNAKPRDEDASLNNAQILKYLAEGNTKAEKLKKRDFISMGSGDAERIAKEYIDNVGPALQRRADTISNKLKDVQRPVTLEQAAKEAANKIAADALMAAMMEVKRIISDRIEKGVDWTGKPVEDLEDDYKKQKERDHHHIYPIGNATGQVVDNLAPGKRNIRIKRK